jgi:hypothetical protein
MARKLNAARKQAVITAILEDGMDGRQASEAAARGELGLEPFEIAPTTARDLASRARRLREANGSKVRPGPDEQKERDWLKLQVDRIMALEEPTAKDFHALKHALAAIDDIDRRAERRAALQPPPIQGAGSAVARARADAGRAQEGPGRAERHQHTLIHPLVYGGGLVAQASRKGERPPEVPSSRPWVVNVRDVGYKLTDARQG